MGKFACRRTYWNLQFKPQTIRDTIDQLTRPAGTTKPVAIQFHDLELGTDRDQWDLPDIETFLARYECGKYNWIRLSAVAYNMGEFRMNFSIDRCDISAAALTEGRVGQLLAPFDRAIDSGDVYKLPVSRRSITLVIGHGRSRDWLELKDHLSSKHGYSVDSFESGSRAGHIIRDVLDQMRASASMALLVLTGEDMDFDGNAHARQNVVHELGLFQGTLGWKRAIAIVEEGVSLFSNMDGILHIPFSKNKISESYGEVLAVIRREFGPKI